MAQRRRNRKSKASPAELAMQALEAAAPDLVLEEMTPESPTPDLALEILNQVRDGSSDVASASEPAPAQSPVLAGDFVSFDPKAEVPDFVQEAMGRVVVTASEWEPIIGEAEDEVERAKALLNRHSSGMIAGILDEGGSGHALDLGLKQTTKNKKGEDVERYLYLRVLRVKTFKDIKPNMIETAITSLTHEDLVQALTQLRSKSSTSGGFARRTSAPRTKILLTRGSDGSVQSVVGSAAISRVSAAEADETSADELAPVALRQIYTHALYSKIRDLAYNGTTDSLRMMTSRPAGHTPVIPEDVDDWIKRYDTLLELRQSAADASKRLLALTTELDETIQGDAPILAPFLIQTNPKSGSRCLDIEDITRGVSASRYLKAKRPTKAKASTRDKKFTIKQAELNIREVVEELVPVLPVTNLDGFLMNSLPTAEILGKLLVVRSDKVRQVPQEVETTSEEPVLPRISLLKPRKVRL